MTFTTLLHKSSLSQNGNREFTRRGLHTSKESCQFYSEKAFLNFLQLERRRSERSDRSFMLVLIGLKAFKGRAERERVTKDITLVLSSTTRDTDIKGWYKCNEFIGVIFNEISQCSKEGFNAGRQHTSKMIYEQLDGYLGEVIYNRLDIRFQIFPGEFLLPSDTRSGGTDKYMSMTPASAKKVSLIIKRIIDISCSLSGIALLAPVFLIVAVLIKINSPGSVFFKQERVGLYGTKFKFFKFRSMYADNDPAIHREFVRNLILGNNVVHAQSLGAGAAADYKIKDDPRVTSIGRFLRKTSIDELPQLFNVLKGDMSLVGPRPPIPYECEEYEIWHRSRVLDMKPGITGLWQVTGRSSTSFDDMVRMDIRYVREWSLWLDLKILLKTPLEVLTCKGAY